MGIIKSIDGVEDSLFAGLQITRDNKYPIDTKNYREEARYKILGLFKDLDNEINGTILIKKDNWQALNTILPKYRDIVNTINTCSI